MSDHYEYKQVIVMRKDLNMRKGKMIAQGAHASMMVVLNFQTDIFVQKWLSQKFAKIVVSVDSEKELQEIHEKALTSGLRSFMIQDSGYTEFNGVPTNTCIAIGPAPAEWIDKVTGHLKLL